MLFERPSYKENALPNHDQVNLYIDLCLLKEILDRQNKGNPKRTWDMLSELFWLATGVLPQQEDMENLLVKSEYWKPKTKTLAHALAQRGYSQKQIAKMLGVSQPTISEHLKKPMSLEGTCPGIRYILNEAEKAKRIR